MAKKDSNKIVITIMSGVEDGREIEIKNFPVTLGRLEDNSICLPYDSKISRHHARITREGDSFWLEDCGSTNGTFLNEKRINEKALLNPGDMFLIGKTWLKFMVR